MVFVLTYPSLSLSEHRWGDGVVLGRKVQQKFWELDNVKKFLVLKPLLTNLSS